MTAPRPLPLVVLSEGASFDSRGAARVVSAPEFLASSQALAEGTVVVNLVEDGGYLSSAWYVSLLAEARGGAPIPEAALLEQGAERAARDRALREEGLDVLDASELGARTRALARAGGATTWQGPLVVDDPDEPKPRPPRPEERFTVRLLAGHPSASRQAPAGTPSLSRLARRVFAAWPLPACEVELVRDAGRWRILDLRPLPWSALEADDRAALVDALRRVSPAAVEPAETPPSLAVLWDGADPSSASSAETLDRLARVAASKGLRVERIGLDDLDRLAQHDALLIRTLTGVDQPAWRFATRAEALGMPVIDHPTAIVRCSNKVYLHELLRRAGLATPRTVVFGRQGTHAQLVEELGSPLVVKIPDGSFSTGVFRVSSPEDFAQRVPALLERTPLLVAQEYLPTTTDWRVGVLDGKVLFAARYHMVPGHWQIRSSKGKSVRYGRVEAVPRGQLPAAVRKLAVAAAGLVGDGFFGVDLKETEGGPVVIEVNDNPNLDRGYEDAHEGDRIYAELVDWYLERLAPRRAPKATPPPQSAPPSKTPEGLAALRRPIGRPLRAPDRPYEAWEVVGLELEYPIVDRDLNVLHAAEGVLSALAGRPTSDVTLGRVGVSNEIVDHVLELKNDVPHRSLRRAEDDLVEGVRRVSVLLADRFRGRLLPGGMHPWLDPATAQRWQRSNRRIYETYERLFDLRTHGWANVQAVHVNLPFGSPEEATAMLNAARLLVPYLPALAASSPLVQGDTTGKVDNRVAWLLEHQARLPESMARLVPEPLAQYSDYRRDILQPMYDAVDRLPDAGALRHEFLNARGAVFKASRASMEVRVLDVQECVAMDVALAWFTRRALRDLAGQLGKLGDAPQATLEADLLAVAHRGSAARVLAPHLPLDAHRAADGTVSAQQVVAWHFERISRRVPGEETRYRDLLEPVVQHGSLSERILRTLTPLLDADEDFTEAARRVWIELADCLLHNQPWRGRTESVEIARAPLG